MNKNTLETYKKLVASLGLEQKGAAMPYTSVNGNMFSFLSPSGSLALRLPEEDREKFLKKYKTSLFKAHGTVLKEYVTVPASMLKSTATLKKYFAQSSKYAKTLKPKASKKRQ